MPKFADMGYVGNYTKNGPSTEAPLERDSQSLCKLTAAAEPAFQE